MTDFKKLYDQGAGAEAVEPARKLRETADAGWEQYYYAAKLLSEGDSEESDLSVIADLMKLAIRAGLSVQKDRDTYLDAMRILSVILTKEEKYDRVQNYLMTILETDDQAPAWVHHYLILAQMHTDQLAHILRRPDWFLKDLAAADEKNEETAKEQHELFRQFLIQAIIWLKDNAAPEVKLAAFEEAAELYGVTGEKGWEAFHKKLSGSGKTDEIPTIQTAAGTQAADARTLYNNLFEPALVPQPAVDPALEEKIRALMEANARLQRELEEKRKQQEEQAQQAATEQQEKQKLAAELSLLQQEKAAAEKKTQDNPVLSIHNRMTGYVYQAQCSLTGWLMKFLPNCSWYDWWQECVVEKLKYEQVQMIQEKNVTTLQGLDLAALLRVAAKNWYRLKKYTLIEDEDYDTLQDMFDVRNNWAHVSTSLPAKQSILDDLNTIYDFLTILGCSSATVNDVQSYIDELEQMVLA